MRSKKNRMISLAVSAALILTNMISPIKAYADDITEEMSETLTEETNENALDLQEPAREPAYVLTLPYSEEISYLVDNARIIHPDGEGREGDIYLSYQAGEKVEFTFSPDEGIEVTQIHLYDGRNNEEPFEVDNERKVSFFMPEKDLTFMPVVTHMEEQEETPPPSQEDTENHENAQPSAAEEAPADETDKDQGETIEEEIPPEETEDETLDAGV